MKPNPGGLLDPDAVVGRKDIIRKIWTTLETRSVVLVADRRYGKSCIIHKMKAESLDGWPCAVADLEGVKTLLELVDKIRREAERHLGIGNKALASFTKFLTKLGKTRRLGNARSPRGGSLPRA